MRVTILGGYVRTIVMEDCRVAVREMGYAVCVSAARALGILQEALSQKKSARWVLLALNQKHKQKEISLLCSALCNCNLQDFR